MHIMAARSAPETANSDGSAVSESTTALVGACAATLSPTKGGADFGNRLQLLSHREKGLSLSIVYCHCESCESLNFGHRCARAQLQVCGPGGMVRHPL